MKEISRWIKYIGMSTRYVIVGYLIGMTALYSVFALASRINSKAFGDTDLEMVQFIDAFVPNSILAFIMGVVLITSIFEMGLRIRANHRELLVAVGVSSVGAIAMIGALQVLLEALVKVITGNVQMLTFATGLGMANIMGIYLVLAMFGVMSGALYKRLGVLRFFVLYGAVGLVMMVGALVATEAVMQGVIQGVQKCIEIPILWVGIASVMYGISFGTLRKLPIAGYQVQQ
ncbi:MAG: hypothetical protein ACRDDX_06180 [Cellulosilyticaceae bacterium]